MFGINSNQTSYSNNTTVLNETETCFCLMAQVVVMCTTIYDILTCMNSYIRNCYKLDWEIELSRNNESVEQNASEYNIYAYGGKLVPQRTMQSILVIMNNGLHTILGWAGYIKFVTYFIYYSSLYRTSAFERTAYHVQYWYFVVN